MTYLISYYLVGFTLLDGPDGFDVELEYKKWKSEIEAKCGPEPNILCYGSHTEWLLVCMATLREYQLKYQCTADFSALFIEHLVQRCGFSRRDHSAIQLW